MPNYQLFEKGEELTKASRALILLHGRGGTAGDILPLANEFCDNHYYVAALQAPNNIWYPQSFMAEDQLNEPYLAYSVEAIKKLLDEIGRHIPKSQIYLMGFSQGACLSLEVSSRFAEKLGGVIAFTGGLIGQTIDETRYKGDFAGTKVFIGNGDDDPYIPLERSKQSKIVMEKLGADVTLKVYQGRKHIISKDEKNWVKENILII
jgi:phospholipase/carboxylesterase